MYFSTPYQAFFLCPSNKIPLCTSSIQLMETCTIEMNIIVIVIINIIYHARVFDSINVCAACFSQQSDQGYSDTSHSNFITEGCDAGRGWGRGGRGGSNHILNKILHNLQW